MLKPIEHRIEIGDGKEIHLETGLLAKQADGAVIVRQGDTMVLCTVVMADSAREGQSFFPLSVEYKERLTAGGRIPVALSSARADHRTGKFFRVALWTAPSGRFLPMAYSMKFKSSATLFPQMAKTTLTS